MPITTFIRQQKFLVHNQTVIFVSLQGSRQILSITNTAIMFVCLTPRVLHGMLTLIFWSLVFFLFFFEQLNNLREGLH